MRHLNEPGKVVVRAENANSRPVMVAPNAGTGATNSPATATRQANPNKDEFGDLG